MGTNESTQVFQEAQALFQQGQYAEALSLLDSLNRAIPGHKDILYLRALCLSRMGKISEAGLICDHLSSVLNDPRGTALKQELGKDLFAEWEVPHTESGAGPVVQAPEESRRKGPIRRFLHAISAAFAAILLLPRKVFGRAQAPAGKPSAGEPGMPVTGEPASSVPAGPQSPVEMSHPTGGQVEHFDIPSARPSEPMSANLPEPSAAKHTTLARRLYKYSGLMTIMTGFRWILQSPLRLVSALLIIALLCTTCMYLLWGKQRPTYSFRIEPPGPVTVNFPDNREYARLSLRDWNAPLQTPWHRISTPGGYARGTVSIPAGKEVKIDGFLSPEIVNYAATIPGLRMAEVSIEEKTLEVLKKLPMLDSLKIDPENIDENRLAALKDLPNIRRLDLNQEWWSRDINPILDQHMKRLAELKSLTSLTLGNCSHVTDEGIKDIVKLKNLEELDLSGCQGITEEGFRMLAALGRLRVLNLTGIEKITSNVITDLAPLKSLEWLNLSGCRGINDDVLAALKVFPKLKSLNLRELSNISDEGLAHLTALPELESLELAHNWNITDEGLRPIGQLAHLKNLFMFQVGKISDTGIKYLSGLAALETLNIGWNKEITDEGIKSIGQLASLKKLEADGLDKVTPAAVVFLKPLSNLEFLDLPQALNVASAGIGQLEHLKGLHCIKSLFVNLTGATDKDLDALREISTLECLSIMSPESGDLCSLNRLNTLTAIDLQGQTVGEKSLACLEKLNNIHKLILNGAYISKEILDHFRAARPDCLIEDHHIHYCNTLHFPEDRSMGKVNSNQFDGVIYERNGDRSVEARGAVLMEIYPATLLLAKDAAADLSPFDALPPDSLLRLDMRFAEVPSEQLAHVGKLTGLRELSFMNGKILGDGGLEGLRGLSDLVYLNLSFTQLGKGGLRGIGGMKGLTRLNLCQADFGKDGVAELANLENLHILDLSKTHIDSDTVKALAQIKKLWKLNLSDTQISDTDLAQLANLSNLHELDLGGTPITGSGLVHLKELDKLEHLSLERTEHFKSKNLACLSAMKGLRGLTLKQMNLNDADLAYVGKIQTLSRWLSLSCNPITDAGMSHLATLTHVRYLNLTKTNVSGQGLVQLRNMPLNELVLTGAPLSDKTVEYLEALNPPMRLWIGGNAAGVDDEKVSDASGKMAGILHASATPLSPSALDEVRKWIAGGKATKSVESEPAPPKTEEAPAKPQKANAPAAAPAVENKSAAGDGVTCNARTLHFPATTIVGSIFLRDKGSTEVRDWKRLGDALGSVAIPKDKEVRLMVRANDVSFLKALGVNDVQAISLNGLKLQDKDMETLLAWKSLQTLDIRDTGVSEACLKELKERLPGCKVIH